MDHAGEGLFPVQQKRLKTNIIQCYPGSAQGIAHQVNHAQPNAEKKHKTFPAAYLRPFLPISWILQHSIRFSKSN